MLALILAMFTAIHPQAQHTGDAKKVANAISFISTHDDPIPGFSREQTAAILSVMAWHESRFRMNAVGDNGEAFCAFQIHGDPTLAQSTIRCTRAALVRLRASAKACPEAPLAPYAGGCKYESARQISRSRLAEAEKILKSAQGSTEPPAK